MSESTIPDWYMEALRLRDDGVAVPEIAQRMGKSESAVRVAYNRAKVRLGRTDKFPRGFAAISKGLQIQFASKGGKSVPPERRSYSQNRDLASRAGRKGGQISRKRGAA